MAIRNPNVSESKHVSMPRWMYVRTANIAEALGCPFSKLVQAALREKLIEWEEEVGAFQIDPLLAFEDDEY